MASEVDVPDVAPESDEDILGTDETSTEEETSDEETTEGDGETPDEETSEDGEEETEDEEETKEEDKKEGDEEEEDGTTERLSTYTDIKKTYPEFFKKFPDVRSALFRDEKYGEMFGSIKDAEQAYRESQIYGKMSDDLVGDGNITPLMDAIHKQKPESLEKIAFSILPYLAEKNKDLYFEVASVPVKSLIRNIVRSLEGKEDKDSVNLRNSALHLHKYVFNSFDVEGEIRGERAIKKPEKTSREAELEKQLTQRETRDQDNFLNEVDGRYVKSVGKLIDGALASDSRLTDWMKAKISTDVIKEVKKQMDGDKRFLSTMNNLIAQAKRSGYNSDFKSRILTAALERAKPLIPSIRKKLVAEALGRKVPSGESTNGSKSAVTNSEKKDKFTPRKATASSSSSQQKKETSKNPDLAILRG